MAPAPPTISTFDPQIAGKVGLSVALPPSYDEVIWKVAATANGTVEQAGITQPLTSPACDALTFIVDGGPAGTVTYWQAQLHDSTGYSQLGNQVAATSSSGPPVLTDEQLVAQGLGITLNVGDEVAVSTVKTVQSDGSIS